MGWGGGGLLGGAGCRPQSSPLPQRGKVAYVCLRNAAWQRRETGTEEGEEGGSGWTMPALCTQQGNGWRRGW